MPILIEDLVAPNGHDPYIADAEHIKYRDGSLSTYLANNSGGGGGNNETGGNNDQEQGSQQTRFKSIVFKRGVGDSMDTPTGGSFDNPVPDGWSDGVPEGTEPLWMSTRWFTSDGLPPQTEEWTAPRRASDSANTDFEFSALETHPGTPDAPADGADWHDNGTTNDIWMATRYMQPNGEWGLWNVVRIKGEKGDKGDKGDKGESITGPRGDMWEWVYGRFNVIPTTTSVSYPNIDANGKQRNEDGYLPEFILNGESVSTTNTPQGVSSSMMYEFSATRRCHDDVWGNFSNPALHSNFVAAGLTDEQLDEIKRDVSGQISTDLNSAETRLDKTEEIIKNIAGTDAYQVTDPTKGLVQTITTYVGDDGKSFANQIISAETATITSIAGSVTDEKIADAQFIVDGDGAYAGMLADYAAFKDGEYSLTTAKQEISAADAKATIAVTTVEGVSGDITDVRSEMDAMEGQMLQSVSKATYVWKHDTSGDIKVYSAPDRNENESIADYRSRIAAYEANEEAGGWVKTVNSDAMSFIKMNPGEINIAAMSDAEAAQILAKAKNAEGQSEIILDATKIHLKGDVNSEKAAIDTCFIKAAKITEGEITSATITDCTINSNIQSAGYNTLTKTGFFIDPQGDEFYFAGKTRDDKDVIISSAEVILPEATVDRLSVNKLNSGTITTGGLEFKNSADGNGTLKISNEEYTSTNFIGTGTRNVDFQYIEIMESSTLSIENGEITDMAINGVTFVENGTELEDVTLSIDVGETIKANSIVSNINIPVTINIKTDLTYNGNVNQYINLCGGDGYWAIGNNVICNNVSAGLDIYYDAANSRTQAKLVVTTTGTVSQPNPYGYDTHLTLHLPIGTGFSVINDFYETLSFENRSNFEFGGVITGTVQTTSSSRGTEIFSNGFGIRSGNAGKLLCLSENGEQIFEVTSGEKGIKITNNSIEANFGGGWMGLSPVKFSCRLSIDNNGNWLIASDSDALSQNGRSISFINRNDGIAHMSVSNVIDTTRFWTVDASIYKTAENNKVYTPMFFNKTNSTIQFEIREIGNGNNRVMSSDNVGLLLTIYQY